MRIAIASDHGGFDQKGPLASYIADELGHEVVDLGPDTADSVDYPDYAEKVARAVSSGDADFGVLICGTGIGMSIAANKVAGFAPRRSPRLRSLSCSASTTTETCCAFRAVSSSSTPTSRS